VNANKHSPEYLSLYVDEVLRTGAKGMTDDELDRLFDDVIILFRFVDDKVPLSLLLSLSRARGSDEWQDVFERFYKVHLGKRLLLGRSASDDAERAMINKLKARTETETDRERMFHL
jgi:cullin 3